MQTFQQRAFVFLSLLFVAGCASRQDPTSNAAPVASTNAAIFDPTTANVPLPNILATATAADPLTGRAVNTPMTPAECLAYINLHEVGNTNAVAGVNAPIYLRFSYPLQPSTVTAANIKVFQITPDPAGTENNPLGFTDVTGMFSFQYPAGGTDLWLFPSFPLAPGTRYLYVVTNRVLDAATGAPIIPSVYFQYLQSPTLPTGAAAGLDPIWANATSGSSILLSGYGKVMGDLIAASATTTITARTDIALMGRFITSGAGFIEAGPSGPLMPVEASLRSFAAGQALGGLTGKTWSNAITTATTFTKGNANPALDVSAYWNLTTGLPAASVPATIGTVVLGNINSAMLSVDPVVVAANPGSMDLTAVAATAYNDAAGVLQPFRDGSGNLTGFYHVPKAIPFVYVAPVAAPPSGGYPLVIFQHGITSQKEAVMGLAGALSGAGFAAVAIDLPMHGALALSPTRTTAQWGQDFMAVGYPLATRTNIQQAAFDLHRLELTAATGGFAGLGAAVTHLRFVGHSLGSIVGAYYLAGNTTLASSLPPYSQASLDLDMKGLLSVPGGRLAYLIQNSPAFGATVNEGLAAVGINAGTPTYNAFFQATQTVVDTADPATMTTPLGAGLPSRLSGRLLIQEATSTTFDALGNPTNGDLVITNPYTRYFGNALGGEAVLGTAAAAAVAPGFYQLGYGAGDLIPSPFMFTLSGASVVPKDEPAAQSAGVATPSEGYFQFNQSGIGHGSLLEDPVNGPLMQKQMLYFLGVTGTSIAIDPTAF